MSEPSGTTGSLPATAEATGSRLRPNAVGVLGILFFVLSAQAPLTGIVGGVPLMLSLGNGSGVPGTYVLVGVMLIVFAVGFVTMSRHVEDAGAFYAYIGRGLGRPVATGSALSALWCYATVQAGMYGLYGAVMSGLFAAYGGVSVPWWACAIVTMLVVQGIGALGVDMGARFLAVLVALEMVILSAFALSVLFSGGGPEGLAPAASFSPGTIFSGAPGVAIMFAVASMFGFESTAIYSEEAKDPHRTVPRATYLSVVVISLFFAFVSWMLVSFYGPTKIASAAGAALASTDSTSLLTVAIGDKLGAWAGNIVAFLLTTSLLAGILAFHNAINRYLYSLGHHGSLPLSVSKVNKRGAPVRAGLVQTGMAIVLVVPFAVLGLDPVLTLFSWMSGVAVLALMVLYLLTSISVIVFFRRTRADARPWQTLIAPALACVMVLSTGVLIIANFTTLIGGGSLTALLLILTVPVVFFIGVGLNAVRGRSATPWRPEERPVVSVDGPGAAGS